MGDRPRRSVPRLDYKHLNNWGTSGRAVHFNLQENIELQDDSLNLSLTPEEEAEFGEDELKAPSNEEDVNDSDKDQSQEVQESCVADSQTETKNTDVKEGASSDDDDLELRLQLLKKRRDDLRKKKLKEEIARLERDIADLSREDTGSKLERKQKKKSGDVKELQLEIDIITIKDLRQSKELGKKVKNQLKSLGIDTVDQNEKASSKKVTKKKKSCVKDKHAKKVALPVSDSGSFGCESDSESDDLTIKSMGLQKELKYVKKGQIGSKRMKKKKQRPVSDSDSSSSSESDSDSDSASSSTENCKSKKSKAKKSGIVSKPTDKVKNPQSFPHNYLQFEYVNKDLKFKQLNFKQLVAGELEIISHFCKNEAENEGRLKLLQKISYYASVYQWSSILDFYAAWLRQIEIGKKSWKDDPQVLESAILSGNFLPSDFRVSSKTSVKSQNSKPNIWFCYKFQRNKCEEKMSPHSATIRGAVKTVHHICATCLQKDGTQKDHPECSDKCPNKTK